MGFGKADLVTSEDEAVVSASDDNGTGVSVAGAVVEEDVVFKCVSVSSERFGFFAKEETDSGVVFHYVVAEEVVGILVTDGDAFTLVGDEFVVFKLSVLDSPADEHAVRFVARGFAVANDRVLGTTSGMEAQACIVIGYTILDDDTVAELEADSIAIEVTNFAIPDCDVFAFEKIDASMAATVHGFAFGAIFVADDGNALDGCILDSPTCYTGHIEFGPGICFNLVIRAKSIGDLKAILAKLCGQGCSSDEEVSRIAITGDQDSVTDLQPTVFFYGDLPLVTVSVCSQGNLDSVDWREDGFAGSANNPNIVTKGQGVTHGVGSGADVDGSASKAGNIFHCGLERSIGGTPNVPLVLPDSNLNHL